MSRPVLFIMTGILWHFYVYAYYFRMLNDLMLEDLDGGIIEIRTQIEMYFQL